MAQSLNEAVISAAVSNTETIAHVSPLEGHEEGRESASLGKQSLPFIILLSPI